MITKPKLLKKSWEGANMPIDKLPLDYPTILKLQIESGQITRQFAINWLRLHHVRADKAIELIDAALARED